MSAGREWREVSAQRARKLRKRGAVVRFSHWQNGHCRYEWRAAVMP